MNPRSITVLPTCVKIKNFIAAYFLLGPPQTPMKKNMGMRTSSKNT